MGWKIQPDGSYISDQSSFKAYLDGGVWKIQNLNVNDSDFLTFAEMLTFPPFPAGTLPNPYTNNINLQSGKNLQVGGVPVAGFYDDGTPYFRKVVRMTMPDTTLNLSVNHNIPNLYSNDRLRALATATRYPSLNRGYGIRTASFPNVAFYPIDQVLYDDTIINGTRGNGTGALEIIFIVEYV